MPLPPLNLAPGGVRCSISSFSSSAEEASPPLPPPPAPLPCENRVHGSASVISGGDARRGRLTGQIPKCLAKHLPGRNHPRFLFVLGGRPSNMALSSRLSLGQMRLSMENPRKALADRPGGHRIRVKKSSTNSSSPTQLLKSFLDIVGRCLRKSFSWPHRSVEKAGKESCPESKKIRTGSFPRMAFHAQDFEHQRKTESSKRKSRHFRYAGNGVSV